MSIAALGIVSWQNLKKGLVSSWHSYQIGHHLALNRVTKNKEGKKCNLEKSQKGQRGKAVGEICI